MEASDKSIIDEIVKSFYKVFANKHSSPNFDLLYEICIPEAQIILRVIGGHIVYNLESFIEPRRVILTDGTLTDFEEYEVTEQTTVLRNVAQRFSRYEKSGLRNGTTFKQMGTKLFQLIKAEGNWKINGVLWEDDLP